jgi:hypothetical protein
MWKALLKADGRRRRPATTCWWPVLVPSASGSVECDPAKGTASNLLPVAKKNMTWDQVLILASEIWQTLGDTLFFSLPISFEELPNNKI